MAHILLVDDDPAIRKVFTKILKKAGHEVVCAENGQEGLELCQNNSFDLIITDMLMPVKDGLKMIMELDRVFPETRIIAVSGGGVIEAERYLRLAGTIGVKKSLTKPVSKTDLLTAVNEILS